MPVTQAGQEIRPLTGLRGVAALYVMVYHYFLGLSFSNPATTFMNHGYLAVDLFFVLSGFVMALNYRHMFRPGWSQSAYGRFLGRRIARIYPLYFVATVCGFGLAVMGYLKAPDSPILITFVQNLAMIQAWTNAESIDGPAWSISAEWAAYLLFPALLVPCLFRRPSLAWISAAVCVAIIAALCMLPSAWGHRHTPAAALVDPDVSQFMLVWMRCLPEFTLGLLAFRLSATPFGLMLAKSRWISAAISLAIIVLLTIPKSDFVVVLLFPMLVISLTSDQHLPGRFLSCPPAEIVGKLSYSIYLMHSLCGGLMTWVHSLVEQFGLRHAQTYVAAVGVLLTLSCSYFAYHMIEVPGRRGLRALFERSQPPSIVS